MKRKLKFAVLILVFFLGWIIAAPFLATNLIVEKPLEKSDAILVLGGSGTYLERTAKAAEVYKQGVAPRILLTDDGERAGWSRAEQKNPAFFELAQKNLVRLGVPAENIEVLPPEVTGTIYEARLTAEKARQDGLKKVLIVTSAYHTRRSLWIFEKIFAAEKLETEIGIVHAATGIQTPNPQIWWLKPKGWQTVAGEYLKSAVYWLFY